MKKYFFLVIICLAVACSKKDNCDNPIDCLPPATQTGAGTIGCLINGQPFSPGGSQFSGPHNKQIIIPIWKVNYTFHL